MASRTNAVDPARQPVTMDPASEADPVEAGVARDAELEGVSTAEPAQREDDTSFRP